MKNPDGFRRLAFAALIATLLLIMIGSVVRVTGAGLGCPDWPHCFGSWIPPTDASQLPDGFDKSQFNAIKTWTEYINRLLGVLTGLVIAATAIRSMWWFRTKPSVTICAGLAGILTVVEAWIGAKVVLTELKPVVITVHLALAMTILCLLVYVRFAVRETAVPALSRTVRREMTLLGVIFIISTAAQILLGTQVREAIDHIMNTMPGLPRETWLFQAGVIHEIHRSFSWLLLGAALWAIFRGRKLKAPITFIRIASVNLLLIGGQMLIGAVLTYATLPPAAQVLHLGNAMVMVSVQMYFILMVLRGKTIDK